ncbi:uncharacterized protein BKA78DRAFT_301209 [Phyllosticta capitalensis]|uniref:uncharacterized protein n=1 Tax=Phyllosticta capitalensis TaxID=121624 RepID=UPI00312EE90C
MHTLPTMRMPPSYLVCQKGAFTQTQTPSNCTKSRQQWLDNLTGNRPNVNQQPWPP